MAGTYSTWFSGYSADTYRDWILHMFNHIQLLLTHMRLTYHSMPMGCMAMAWDYLQLVKFEIVFRYHLTQTILINILVRTSHNSVDLSVMLSYSYIFRFTRLAYFSLTIKMTIHQVWSYDNDEVPWKAKRYIWTAKLIKGTITSRFVRELS